MYIFSDHDLNVPMISYLHVVRLLCYIIRSSLDSQRQRKRIKRARGGAKRRQGQGQEQGRRKDNDPLQTFEASELGADGSYGVRGPGGGLREGGRGGGSGGDGGFGFGEEGEGGGEGDREAAAKRMNEERESRVMQVSHEFGVRYEA